MPKKITNIKYVARARNAEHYHLQEQILAIITEAFATKFNITSVYTSYASAFQKEDEAYLQSVAYADTKQIEAKNDERTGGLRYLQLGIQSKQFSPVADEKEAAESLLFMMKPYWNASLKPYTETSAMITDLVKKLQSDEWSEKITTLGLTDAVTNLKTLNEEFITVYSHRADEKLVRQTSDSLKTARPQVDKAFRDLADAVNAIYLVAETIEKDSSKVEEIGAVIDAVNAQILQFSETLSRRGAGSKTDFPTEEPSGEEPGEEGEEEEPSGEGGERPGGL